MNILYIWDSYYPWDVRVDKICRSLIEEGHEVHIASRNLKNQPVYEKHEGMNIHRTKSWQNRKLNYMLSFPLFCSPVWSKLINYVISKYGVDLIIVRDLPMAIAGIWAGKRHNLPVVFDMAEDYVALVKDIWDDRKFQGLNLIVRNPYLAKLVEKYTFKNADKTLVVVEEAKNVVLRSKVDEDRIAIVGNTPEIKLFENTDNTRTRMTEEISRNYSVIYTGGIQLGRGLQVVFDAIPGIIKKIPNFKFYIVGDGYATQELKALVDKKEIKKYVQWLGWVEHKEIYGYLRECKIGLIPHFTSPHVNTTIPNKIYDYMACKLPVIASDAPPMKRLIRSEKCGEIFLSGNCDSFIEAVMKIYGNEVEYQENGASAIYERYNWNNDKKRLLDALDSLGVRNQNSLEK